MESPEAGRDLTTPAPPTVGSPLPEPPINRAKFSVADLSRGQLHLRYPLNLIIDTPQFQRLRNLKQLGLANLVYPCATHTRFEHSLGVSYLAGKFAEALRRAQQDLNIDDSDILAVQVAGLCHDLGHGPFSHLWDLHLVPLMLKEAGRAGEKYSHEETSIKMFHWLLKQNPKVKLALDEFLTERDYLFIQEAITGEPLGDTLSEYAYLGRPREKAFLYDLISNKMDGFDVDRFDYYLRDSKYSGVAVLFNDATLERLVENCLVLVPEEGGRPRICYSRKVQKDLQNAVKTRFHLHETVYQHKTIKIIEWMYKQVFSLAAKHLTLLVKDENQVIERVCLLDAITDMRVFEQLHDHRIIEEIKRSLDVSELDPARELLRKIECRELHRFVMEIVTENRPRSDGGQSLEEHVVSKMHSRVMDMRPPDVHSLAEKQEENNNDNSIDDELIESKKYSLEPYELAVHCTTLHHGSFNCNPMKDVRLYAHKELHARAGRLTETELSAAQSEMPSQFSQHKIWIFLDQSAIARNCNAGLNLCAAVQTAGELMSRDDLQGITSASVQKRGRGFTDEKLTPPRTKKSNSEPGITSGQSKVQSASRRLIDN